MPNVIIANARAHTHVSAASASQTAKTDEIYSFDCHSVGGRGLSLSMRDARAWCAFACTQVAAFISFARIEYIYFLHFLSLLSIHRFFLSFSGGQIAVAANWRRTP